MKMSLFKLKSAPLVLIEDDIDKNTIPLLSELVNGDKNTLNLFCYEQPVKLWKNVFKEKTNIIYYEEFNPNFVDKYTSEKCTIIIDSVVQMALYIGWKNCIKILRLLTNNSNVGQVCLVLHRDCLSHHSQLQVHLHHIASAIVSYDTKDPCKISVQLKKSGKVFKSEEILSYDAKARTLKSTPVIKEDKKEEEPPKPSPGTLSTFKIEVEQTEKLEKYKLQLPYMSKINEGESKVYYEPDAVDDWDEEDPDEDLDI